jgi:hypothetical protein
VRHVDARYAAALWPAAVEEILTGDQAVAFGQVTPAGGVVLHPLTNMGLCDPGNRRVVPVSSSVGMWKKLRRMQESPRVAIAYHTREHGYSTRPEYVLVQGIASLTPPEDRTWVERNREAWERFAGPLDTARITTWWLSAYHWRVGVEVAVERIVVWPDLTCQGEPEIHGEPLPSDQPVPQRPPRKGVAPRIDHRRAARRATRLPNRLLAWVGADGYPVIAPVRIAGCREAGIALEAPSGVDVAPSGRRAGLLSHSFDRYTFGQHQRKHTGWMVSEGREVLYAPHTQSGYRLPESRLLFRVASGFVTRRGLREARRAGFVGS